MKGTLGKYFEEAIKFLELSNTKNVLEKEKILKIY